MTAIQLITFDLDNTLWDTHKLIPWAEQGVYQWLAQHCPKLTQSYTVEALFEARIAYWKQHPELKHQLGKMRRASLKHILQGCGYDDKQADEKSTAAFDIFMNYRHQISFFEHALTVLEALSRDYSLGIISNGNACSKRLGIDHYFDFHYKAEDLNASKPSAIPYETALQHAGVQAFECIHIGDSKKDDIQGASALGIHTIWFNPQGDQWANTTYSPTVEIHCLSEVPTAVATVEHSIDKRE